MTNTKTLAKKCYGWLSLSLCCICSIRIRSFCRGRGQNKISTTNKSWDGNGGDSYTNSSKVRRSL